MLSMLSKAYYELQLGISLDVAAEDAPFSGGSGSFPKSWGTEKPLLSTWETPG